MAYFKILMSVCHLTQSEVFSHCLYLIFMLITATEYQ